ncbi:atypical MEK-related kinase (incomplete catalytic triad) [Besnoitia besnoiti]|uniref:Atypical MEK-related kinase (Incomplete catalytic triad) n=1 Tax=Besnoitia besnoiti TaxID=94643 RepID=A0A2A9MQ00_BESBE|nr:atypical MEK-related kinase (incomplete catalytic triad) [Besnoitia besnoiti]PFH37990.1 atypical MEK-related kinase (incomplete catalytic triad) [Besnoitia besnoiti]
MWTPLPGWQAIAAGHEEQRVAALFRSLIPLNGVATALLHESPEEKRVERWRLGLSRLCQNEGDDTQGARHGTTGICPNKRRRPQRVLWNEAKDEPCSQRDQNQPTEMPDGASAVPSVIVKTYRKLDEEIFVPVSGRPMKRREALQRIVNLHSRVRHPHIAQLLAVGLRQDSRLPPPPCREPDSLPIPDIASAQSAFEPSSTSRCYAPGDSAPSSSLSTAASLATWPFPSISLVLQDGGLPLALKLRDLQNRTAPEVVVNGDAKGRDAPVSICGADDALMTYCVPVIERNETTDCNSGFQGCRYRTPPKGCTYVLAEAAAREVLRQLLAALQAMHAKRIFHLDVKPSNVVVAAPFDPAQVRKASLRPVDLTARRERCLTSETRKRVADVGPGIQHPHAGPKRRRARAGRAAGGDGSGLQAREALPAADGHQKADSAGDDAEDNEAEVSAAISKTQTGCARRPDAERCTEACPGRRIQCLLIDFDSAQSGIGNTTNVYPGGTTRAFIPPEELCPGPCSGCQGDAAAGSHSDLEGSQPAVLNGEKKDVWALGCLMTILLTGRHPFLRAPGWHTRASAQTGGPRASAVSQMSRGDTSEEETGFEFPSPAPQDTRTTTRYLQDKAGGEHTWYRNADALRPTCEEGAAAAFEGEDFYYSDMEYCLALVSGGAPRVSFSGLPDLSSAAQDLLRKVGFDAAECS